MNKDLIAYIIIEKTRINIYEYKNNDIEVERIYDGYDKSSLILVGNEFSSLVHFLKGIIDTEGTSGFVFNNLN